MAISRKPKPQANGANADVDVDALISKGGTVASSQTLPRIADTATVNLRMPVGLVERIDDALKVQPIKKPRHTWLLEAVMEKLERESA